MEKWSNKQGWISEFTCLKIVSEVQILKLLKIIDSPTR